MNASLRLLFSALAVTACFAASSEGPQTFPVGPGGKLFGQPDVEELMSRPYRDYVPMACVGECLWAAHPEGWAFGNGVYYYLLNPADVGFDSHLEANGKPIPVNWSTFYPSRVEMRNDDEELQVKGYKWITDDDVLALRLDILNRAATEAQLKMALTLPASGLERQGDRFSWNHDQMDWKVFMTARAPGFEPVEKPLEAMTSYWVEAEAPANQRGSDGRDAKPAASGGQVLGTNFGGDENDFAEYRLEVRAPMENAVLSIRYARATPGDAEYKVEIPSLGFAERRGFSTTHGWGGDPRDFELQTFPLGKVPAGTHTIRIVAVAAKCNVNFDALCIHDAENGFPGVPRPETVLTRAFSVPPQTSETVYIFQAAGSKAERVQAALNRVVALNDPLQDQIERYSRWLTDNVPAFTASSEPLTRQYWHRATSIIRKNLFRFGDGRLKRWAMAEGRWSSPWFGNVISYGAPHHVREMRWMRDPVYARDILSTWCENEKENGVFPSFIRPDAIGGRQYTEWITSTAWDAFCVSPDLDMLMQWAEPLKRNVDGWLATYDTDNDGLLVVDSHWWTGMEWQPSFFYFNGFDKDQQDQHLERVDLTAYVYGNAKNLARVLKAIGDPDAAKYEALASKMAKATFDVLWDKDTAFFYSVEPQTHEKAMVKEVIGVYPFYFGMVPQDGPYAEAWRSILDPEEFWTEWPVASATKKCPAYSQDIMFNGKEVGGCMWNGPTWPHANSIVLSAMAETLRTFESSPLDVSHFYSLLVDYTAAQFHQQFIDYPWTGEYYSGDTAEWRTQQRDYNHSTYLDIIIADMAGLRPRADNILEIRPIVGSPLESFLLDGVRYHGHDITIAWNAPDSEGESPDALKGLRVYADGSLVYHEVEWPRTTPGVRLDMDQGFKPVGAG